jgi:SPFH domain / Band 7 family
VLATIFVAILMLAGVGVLVAVPVTSTNKKRRAAALGIAIICAVLSAVVLVGACYDRVDTRNVGIITQFGKPVGEHGAGIVWHAPWQDVSEMSEAIQLQTFEGSSFSDHGTAVQVRLKNNSTAYVDENLNWRLREGRAPRLFQDYGGSATDVFANIAKNLVDRQAQVALSEAFATFDPSQSMQAADLPAMAAQVKSDLQAKVGQDIEILDVRIPRIFYDDQTQQRFDSHNQKVQETANAAQDVLTAQQQALANNALAQSVGNPMVIVGRCVDEQVKAGKDPAGCWGPLGGAGSGEHQPLVTVPLPGH